jgi:hypothetical protein
MSKNIKKTIAEYKHESDMKKKPTPAAPGTILPKLDKKEEAADHVDKFCKYIGRVLCTVLKLLPDCVNVIRNLMCHMTAPLEGIGTTPWLLEASLQANGIPCTKGNVSHCNVQQGLGDR